MPVNVKLGIKVGGISLRVICKKWVDLRELPDIERSEASYIRLQDIERISFIENESEGTHTIFVSAWGEKYLYSVVDTFEDAELAVKGLIQDIENSVNL